MDVTQITWDEFTADHIEQFLRKSFVYVGLDIGYEKWWHCVVLYRVSAPPQEEPSYSVMDPAKGNKGDRAIWRKGDFFRGGMDRNVLIGWKVDHYGRFVE